jgi:asparagine synthase (glutamine-hydrolysing)
MTDLLAPDSIGRRGYFNPDTVQLWMTEHLSEKANHSHRLWSLMLFELWSQHALN